MSGELLPLRFLPLDLGPASVVAYAPRPRTRHRARQVMMALVRWYPRMLVGPNCYPDDRVSVVGMGRFRSLIQGFSPPHIGALYRQSRLQKTRKGAFRGRPLALNCKTRVPQQYSLFNRSLQSFA